MHDVVKNVKAKRIAYERNRLKRRKKTTTTRKEPLIAKVQPLSKTKIINGNDDDASTVTMLAFQGHQNDKDEEEKEGPNKVIS